MEKFELIAPCHFGMEAVLKREILNLEEKTLEELKGKEDVVEGNITIGCRTDE